MKSIFKITATELRNILTEKNIQHEFVVGEYDTIWIGIRLKTQYNWLHFYDENTANCCDAQTYSQNTGKTSKGYETRQKVYSRFEKIINN